MTDHIAVIGAGLAGLACASRLTTGGAQVTVYDKSRGPGGRSATRRALDTAFDHGAQYFTVRDPEFARRLAALSAAGQVAPFVARWGAGEPVGEALYVGVPGMSALGGGLAAGLVLHTDCQVVALHRAGRGWLLEEATGRRLGPYASVVVAIPAPQAHALAGLPPALVTALAPVVMQPCIALMVAYAAPLAGAFDVDWRPDPVLPFVCRNSAKPGRAPPEAWVLHADGDWSAQRLDADPVLVTTQLLAAFAARIGRPLPTPVGSVVHRWRYARVTVPLGAPYLYDAATGVGLCGDWCLAARIEAAYQSGQALADRLLSVP